MKMKILLLALIFINYSISVQIQNLVIESLNRKTNLQSQYSLHDTSLRIKNNEKETVNKFYFTIYKCLDSKLTLLTFKTGKSPNFFHYNKIEDLQLMEKHNVSLYEVEIPNLKPQEKLQISIHERYYGRMNPLPKKIGLMVI